MLAEFPVCGRTQRNFKCKYKLRMTILSLTEKSVDYCLMFRISLTWKSNWRDMKIASITILGAIVLNS